jgi:hypothetical protein
MSDPVSDPQVPQGPSSAAEASFSLKQVLATAVITLVVSGLGGAFIQSFFSRAAPSIAVTSIAFTGPNEVVKLPESLINASLKDLWGDDLNPYEPFETLLKRERKTQEILERLRKASEATNDWLSANAPQAGREGVQLLLASAVRAHPRMHDPSFSGSLTGMIKRRELPPPPIAEADVVREPALFPMEEEEGAWVLHLGQTGVRFLYDSLPPDLRTQMKLMMLSFQHGIYANIQFYSQQFKSQSAGEMSQLIELQKLLRTVLLPQARLTANISLYNSGGTAVTFRPFFALRILHKDFANTVFVMAPSGRKKDVVATGAEFNLPLYLPETSSSPYINVPPNQLVEVTVTATTPLGDNGERIKGIYESGLLSCLVLGKTDKGREVRSASTRLGEGISPEDKSELIRSTN